ncbi:dityrosine transporter A Q resistance [Scheffersomyces xylosifermentans]|uniref:dityrosine transporter A Q resistance n=1 Tax=Scheffersomyces xylosifermentans TaxID=1304137 RepID=UPI00315D0246
MSCSSDSVTHNKDDLEKNVGLTETVSRYSPPYSDISEGRTLLIICIVTSAGFLGPVAGNIYIPVLPLIQEVFKISTTTANATVSVFMAVCAVAPLFWASWADFGGRKTLYIISLLFFIVSNILLASIPANVAALFILRIIQAIGASSVMSVGAGTVADITAPKKRGRAISYFMLGPQLGPILGPLFSLIASQGNWRWIFGFLSIIGSIIYVTILFFLPETLRCLVGRGECYRGKRWIVHPRLIQKQLIEESISFPRPPKPSLKVYWKLLKFKPLLLCSINGGLLFATFYGMTITFAKILRENYKFPSWKLSVSYLCPGASLIIGSIIGGRIIDRIVSKKEEHIPESRFYLQIIGLLISMVGILGYGWCAHFNVHVAAVFVFSFLGGFGMTWVFVGNTTYLTECSTGQPATNVAIANFMRNVGAAISSVIVEKIIEKIGYGWCFTGLGLLDLIGIAFVLILMKFGPRWRRDFSSTK